MTGVAVGLALRTAAIPREISDHDARAEELNADLSRWVHRPGPPAHGRDMAGRKPRQAGRDRGRGADARSEGTRASTGRFDARLRRFRTARRAAHARWLCRGR